MEPIALICLDFDGTVLAYDESPGLLHPLVVRELNALKERGVSWCTNSGRDAASQLEILDLSRGRGLAHPPEALLCGESLIFERRDGRYVPCEPWNSTTLGLQRRFHGGIQETVRPLLDGWRAKFEAEVYLGDEHTVFNVADVDSRPARLLAELAAALKGAGDAVVTRNGGWLSVLPEELGKGNVLRGYYLNSPFRREATLAVGDHLNDLSMLDGAAAGYVGCPGDAVPEVVAAVEAAGGYVATSGGPEGTVEVIQHFLRGAA